MAFDYKKEYKEFYLPKNKPGIVTVPAMNFVAVRGKGDPNEDKGEYMAATQVLYGIAYTIKMSKMGNHRLEGCFDYVVPPLEGFWWQEVDGKPVAGFYYSDKALMKEYAGQNGYSIDIIPERYHHEIYLSDPRKTVPEKLKTIIQCFRLVQIRLRPGS